MYIDTHCHIEKKYYSDIDSLISDNITNNIDIMITSNCEKDTLEETLELINKYEKVYATIGYHPDQVEIIDDSDIDKLKEIILNNDKIVGIGEIGLDYHYDKSLKEKQIELFEKQLKLAEELNMPVVIHTREATADTINTLKKYKVTGVIHCFSGSLEVANIYIKMGFKLGIGGVVTFKNSNLKDTLKNIDLNNIVLETDSPYMSPEPYRGKTNTSKNINIIARCLSEIYNVSIEEISKITTNNTYNKFTGLHKK